MTLNEALLAQGGNGKIKIHGIPTVHAFISTVSDDEAKAIVLYRKEKMGKPFEKAFYLDQLELIKEDVK